MNRGARLRSARHWLASQAGRAADRIAKSYRKRYGVDWPCALTELQALGVRLDQAWVEQLKRTLAGHIQQRAQRQAEQRQREQATPFAESNEHFAYVAGHTEGGAPFGVTWEEWRESNAQSPSCTAPSTS